MGIIRNAYKSLFGKDYGPVWQQFADEKKGEYSPISDHRVLFNHTDFTVAFDAYTHYTVVGHTTNDADYTRGFAEFISPDDFTFRLTEQGFFENIAKLFGAQDIEVGDREFDKRFMIRSNDHMRTSFLLSKPEIAQPLQELQTLRFEITQEEGLWGEKPNEGKYMLYCVIEGKLKTIDDLNRLHQLFVSTLDKLIK